MHMTHPARGRRRQKTQWPQSCTLQPEDDRDELLITMIVSILSFSNSNKFFLRINFECPLVVSLVLQPVEELNDDGTSERPQKEVVVLTFHDASIDRQVATLTTTITIGKHIEA